jgi:hypothetical protein
MVITAADLLIQAAPVSSRACIVASDRIGLNRLANPELLPVGFRMIPAQIKVGGYADLLCWFVSSAELASRSTRCMAERWHVAGL